MGKLEIGIGDSVIVEQLLKTQLLNIWRWTKGVAGMMVYIFFIIGNLANWIQTHRLKDSLEARVAEA